jgi:hypothetical protein
MLNGRPARDPALPGSNASFPGARKESRRGGPPDLRRFRNESMRGSFINNERGLSLGQIILIGLSNRFGCSREAGAERLTAGRRRERYN